MGSIPTGPMKRRYDETLMGERDGKCTPWMNADELGPFLEEGDMVEFDRTLYTHWGVFVEASINDGVYFIVHLSGDLVDEAVASMSGVSAAVSGTSLGASLNPNSSAATVQRWDIVLVANGGRCRVNNRRDIDLIPFPPDIIVERAVAELDKKKYNILFTNCEHFATWCRYGTKHSRQSSVVKSIATGVLVGVSSWSAAYGALGAGAYYMTSRLGHRILNRLQRGRVGW